MTASDSLIERLADRKGVLLATADLFDVIGEFMEGVAKGTWADYEAAPETEAAKGPLRQKHREAMRIRDDYRSAAKENRSDAELFDTLLKAKEASQ
jgi:hypothetical protein